MLLIKGFIVIFVHALQNQHFFFFGLSDRKMWPMSFSCLAAKYGVLRQPHTVYFQDFYCERQGQEALFEEQACMVQISTATCPDWNTIPAFFQFNRVSSFQVFVFRAPKIPEFVLADLNAVRNVKDGGCPVPTFKGRFHNTPTRNKYMSWLCWLMCSCLQQVQLCAAKSQGKHKSRNVLGLGVSFIRPREA